MYYVERKITYVRMRFGLDVDIVGIVVGVVAVDLAELDSRGWYTYRGDAAENFIDKC